MNLLRKSPDFRNICIKSVLVDTLSSPLTYQVKEAFNSIPVHQILPNEALRGRDRKREHEERIVKLMEEEEIDWILLAGYLPIVGETLLAKYKNRIINIHPALLPEYRGLDSYRRAFEDKVEVAGVSIHFVDEGIDTGEIILQEKFYRDPEDTLTDFVNKGKAIELQLFPKILEMINSGRL